jgi:hypothetical protein
MRFFDNGKDAPRRRRPPSREKSALKIPACILPAI